MSLEGGRALHFARRLTLSCTPFLSLTIITILGVKSIKEDWKEGYREEEKCGGGECWAETLGSGRSSGWNNIKQVGQCLGYHSRHQEALDCNLLPRLQRVTCVSATQDSVFVEVALVQENYHPVKWPLMNLCFMFQIAYFLIWNLIRSGNKFCDFPSPHPTMLFWAE